MLKLLRVIQIGWDKMELAEIEEQVLTNGYACKAKIIESIAGAGSSIKIAMAYFTDRQIASQILNTRRDKGVNVKIVLSDDRNNDDIKALLGSECEVYTNSLGGRGLMHHKFCIIDNALLLHGSYNYTYNASNNNQESLNITDSYSLVSRYSEIFDSLMTYHQDSIAGNPTSLAPKNGRSFLDRFIDELRNHISNIFGDVDYNKERERGRKLSEESNGAKAIFLNNLNAILAHASSTLNRDETTRVSVKTRMTASLDNAIEQTRRQLDLDINQIIAGNSHRKEEVQYRTNTANDERGIRQDELNKERLDLLHLESQISEINMEIDTLDKKIVTKKFWTFQTIIKIAGLTILLGLLCLFFASSFWKILYEPEYIQELNEELGIKPSIPEIIDFDALQMTKTRKGWLAALFAGVFFLLPILLTNIKQLIPDKKITQSLCFIVGLIGIDILVSFSTNYQIFQIDVLLDRVKPPWTFMYAIKDQKFYLTFLFGALPLFLSHVLIENIQAAYDKSSPERADRERFHEINLLKRRLGESELQKSIKQAKIREITDGIGDLQRTIESLNLRMNEVNNAINNEILDLRRHNETQENRMKEVYNSFIASVDSGDRRFLKNAIQGHVTAFKEGFFLFITSWFAAPVAAGKNQELEVAYNDWDKENFE